MKNTLPKLADLHHDVQEAFKTDQLNLLLNQTPPDSFVKDHPFAKNVKYVPIGKIEFLLTKIFQEWRVEVIGYSQLFNSISCHIRLHYKNPLNGVWSYHDGLGAVGVQTDKGASASDLGAIKQDAVMKALPAAKSYAIKDAAENLGALFGRDLNRKDVTGFQMTYDQPIPDGWQISQFETLIVGSGISEEKKKFYEDNIMNMQPVEVSKILEELRNSQPDKIASGNGGYSQTEIKNHLNKIS